MKYVLFMAFFAFVDYYAAAQADSNNIKMKDYYLQKSKSQNTVAWIFLGAGAATAIIGTIIAGSVEDEDDFTTSFNDAITGSGLIVIGAASCITSIPFFIVSGNNKRKAMSLSAGFQQIPMPANGLTIKQPAISIRVTVGR